MTSYRTPKARLGRTGRWVSLLVAAFVLLGIIAGLPLLSPAWAQSTAAMKEELAAKQASLQAAWAKLDAIQDRLNELAAAFNDAETREGELEDEIRDTNRNIEEKKKMFAKIEPSIIDQWGCAVAMIRFELKCEQIRLKEDAAKDQ